MITTNHTLKQQVKISPEFLESTENGVKYILSPFIEETGCKHPFYYLTQLGDDLDKKIYTFRMSNKKEKFVYCTVDFSEDKKVMEKRTKDFIDLNKHLNIRFDAIDLMGDDFIRERATLRFEVY